MSTIDWQSILQQVIARSTEFIFGAVGGFLAAWLAFRYGIKRDLMKLQAELQQSIQKTRIDKTSQIMDDLWREVQNSIEKAAILTAMYKQYPDFRFLTDAALTEFLESSFLTESQKRELLDSSDRTKYYINARFWFDLNEARQALYRLNNSLQVKRIYVPDALASSIEELVSTLNGLFISYEIWHESEEPDLMKKARDEINQAQQLATQVEFQIKTHLNNMVAI